MIKERIQEVVDFTKSESPYRKANKGWINKDIYLDISSSSDALNQKEESAKVTLFWSPINSLISNIFLIIIIGSLLVFTSLSFAKGRVNLDLFNNSSVNKTFKSVGIKVEKTDQFGKIEIESAEFERNLEKDNLDEKSKVNFSDNSQSNLDDDLINKKIDKKETLNRNSQINKDTQKLSKQKSKTNFI